MTTAQARGDNRVGVMTNGWPALELRYLAALRAIAEEGSFGRAADRLGYTQSAISQQIAALERIVGRRLIERPGGRRPGTLTEAGEVLLGHATAIEARAQAARADLAALDEGTAGLVHMGTYQSVGARVLPRIMREFGRAWPDVEIRLFEAASDEELLEPVRDGRLDLTFVLLPPTDGPFATRELLYDHYMLVTAAGDPLTAGGQAPGLEEIAGRPLIGFPGCRHEKRIEAELQALGVDVATIFRSEDNATIQGLVAEGMGIALMPRLTVDLSDARISAVELDNLLPPRVIGLAWHRDRRLSPAVRAFVEVAAAVCGRAPTEPVRTP
jgi:molybdate transport repressor ModE-like protein